MTAGDFQIDGVPYAKVLYLEGNVWIRPPDQTTFHRLSEDEPIPAQSVIYTGFNGILDFAPGPGMAARMVPGTLTTVQALPQPVTESAPTTAAPEAAQLLLRKGTIFSALGREDNGPIDYEVHTPQGVAGARGTMFSTSASLGYSSVEMLHGTVNFETGDHQTSQITEGQSQSVFGGVGKFRFEPRRTFNPANSSVFFNHAGGLLEHASGYGAVRRGLGPDVARTLRAHGYALPAETERRFQNAGRMHYQRRPAFNRTYRPNHVRQEPMQQHAAPTIGLRRENAQAQTQAEHKPKPSPSTPEERKRERKDKPWGQ
ncbi:MAG: FecR family protein [Methylacidiphilales bacterium]|nr:FecR family protein [Candidatus Methylacidiphilales bacterium]